MTTGNFVRSLFFALALVFTGAALAQPTVVDLTPGVAMEGVTIATPHDDYSVLHTTQYRVTVPENAINLTVTLSYDSGQIPALAGKSRAAGLSGGLAWRDLDLLIRYSGTVSLEQYDYIGDSFEAPEVVEITLGSTPPLTAGPYYIGIEVYSDDPVPYEILALVTTSSVSPTPTPSPTPLPTQPPTGVLGIVFPPAVEEDVPIVPVRSVQSRALGSVDQMIPLAFKMQTPPRTYSAQAGNDVYLPGTDNHFYSLTWQKSDRVAGIPEGLMLGSPDSYTGSLPGPPPYDLGIGSLFGTYPNFLGDPEDPIDPRTGVFGALIYSSRFGDNYPGNAVSAAVRRFQIPPGIEILPGLAGDKPDALSTAAYEFGGFSAPLAVADVRYAATRDFVVDNIFPEVVNAYLNDIPVLPNGSAPDFFFVRRPVGGVETGIMEEPPSVVVRWDGSPGRNLKVGHRDDIDIDRQDTVSESTIPSVHLPVTYAERNTQLNQEIRLQYNSPSVVPTGRYHHHFVPVDVAVSGRLDSAGNLIVDDLGNVGQDVHVIMDVDNVPPAFLSVHLFNVTIGIDTCIAGDGPGPSANDQTVRLTAVIEEPDIDEGVPGAGIDTSRITADLTEFGFGAAEAPDSITVDANNRYGHPRRVTAVWTRANVNVRDATDVTARVTAYDLVGNHSTGSDDIIGDNTLPVVENAVIINTRDEVGLVSIGGDGSVAMIDPRGKYRTDALRNGDHATVLAHISDVLCGISIEGITANLTEISGNAADTAVAPATFENGVAVWQLVCGNNAGASTEVLGVVPTPIVINVDITAKDHVLNTRVVNDADQGLSALDNGAFPPPSGVGIWLDNTAPTVTNAIITADNPPHEFIANGQLYTVTATFTDLAMVDVERTYLGVAELNDPGVTPTQILASRFTQSATNPRPFEQVTLVWTTDATTFVRITRSDPVTQDVFIDFTPTDTLGNSKTFENVASIRLDNQAPTLTSAVITNLSDERDDCVNNGKTVRITAVLTDGPLGSGVRRELITADLSRLRLPEGAQEWKAVLPDSFDVVSGAATWTFTLGSNLTVPTNVNFDLTMWDRVGNRRDVLNADPDGILLDNQGPTISNVVITNQTLATEAWIRLGQIAVVSANVSDGSGCGVLAEGISADLSQLSGNAADTAVAPDSFASGVAIWNVTVANPAASPVNVNVAVNAVDELGNAALAPVGDPNGILLDNEAPVILDANLRNLTRDREDAATRGDVLRVSARINDGTGSGIDPSGMVLELSFSGGGGEKSLLGSAEVETEFGETQFSYAAGVATWDVTILSERPADVITARIRATDRVGNENSAEDTIVLDNEGPAITNVEIFNLTRSINTEIRRTEQARITATIADAVVGLDTDSIRANLFQLSGLPADATVAPMSFDPGSSVATWVVTVLNAQPGPLTLNVDVWARDTLGNLTLLVNADPDGITLDNSKALLQDLNGDGVIDYLDLLIMAENWGLITPASPDPVAAATAPGDPLADLNLDGVIDEADLLLFMDALVR